MANMETFYQGLMASESVQSYVGSLKFKANGDYAEIHDGALVVLGDLADSVSYDGTKDDNVYEAEAPKAVTDEVVIVDLAEISQRVIAGNNYKMGIKLVGLRCMPGYAARYRHPMKNDRFWVSGDCFDKAPEVGKFAGVKANDTHFAALDVKAAEGFCVKVIDSRDFTVGNGAHGSMYLCRVL